jgi:Ca2+-binding RTX toxin-like protein
VSYGNFTGTLPAGTPAVATPFESTLERRITPNCSTALDGADDTDNSATDFALSTRPPRNNSTAPTEKLCDGVAPPPGSNIRCRGKRATLIGTSGKNEIKGTKKRDVIVAFGGKDTVNGRGGNDVICGNAGKDNLKGGSGKDVLVGGAGPDTLLGGRGGDTLIGQKGNDTCVGGARPDTAKGCEKKRSL